MNQLLCAIALAFLLPIHPTFAQTKLEKGALDTAAIHALYINGDFDKAVPLLESELKNNKKLTHVDSVFAFRHLGVMAAAQEATREKGKYYMVQLLTIEPTARILDMYASDMIYMIFKNIKDEFDATHTQNQKPGAVATSNQSNPKSTSPSEKKKSESGPSKSSHRSTYYWMGGGVALVGAGIATYFLTKEPETTVVTYDIH